MSTDIQYPEMSLSGRFLFYAAEKKGIWSVAFFVPRTLSVSSSPTFIRDLSLERSRT